MSYQTLLHLNINIFSGWKSISSYWELNPYNFKNQAIAKQSEYLTKYLKHILAPCFHSGIKALKLAFTKFMTQNVSTYTELCLTSVSGMGFVGRNSSSATRITGSNHSSSFILKQADKICSWIKFEDHVFVMKYKEYIFVNYSEYFEEGIISHY